MLDFFGDLRDAALRAINPAAATDGEVATPAYLRDAAAWPKLLRPLIDEYGIVQVWEVGLRTCGHPPTWGVEGTALRRLEEAMKAERPDGLTV